MGRLEWLPWVRSQVRDLEQQATVSLREVAMVSATAMAEESDRP